MNRRRGPIFVDDIGLAAEEVIDHAVDGLLVAGNDAAGENDGVALFDFGVLVVIDRGTGERGHGLSLGTADQNANFFGRKILHLARIDEQAFGHFDITEVFGDLGGVVHGATDEGDFASVLVGKFDGKLDAVNGA